MWAWSDPSLPVQVPANHGQLKGRGRAPQLTSLMWLGVVSFSCPPFSVHNPEHVAAGAESYYWN